LGCHPGNCSLLGGVPVSMEDYSKLCAGEIQSDFLQNCCHGRMKFYNEICIPVNNIIPKIKKLGCSVILNAREEDIQNVFSRFEVIILFSHWRDDHIEFNGRLIHNEELCSYIPSDFAGVIDLCACQPQDGLVVAIKQRAPACSIRCSLVQVTADLQLEIVNLSLGLVSKFKIGYLEATSLILQQIFKKHHKTKNRKWNLITSIRSLNF